MSNQKRIQITQVKSVIGCPQKQKDTVRALGLKGINRTVLHQDRPEIRGMIARVSHLVRVSEV